MKKALIIVGLMLSIPLAVFAQTADAPGCKDPSLFPTRMPDYRIENCKAQDFGRYEFAAATGPKIAVEGKFIEVTYVYTGAKANEPSGVEIIRNYENAVTKVGGAIVKTDPQRLLTATITSSDGQEAWAEIIKGNGKIWIKIIEKKAMTQHVEASAEIFSSDIKSTGHAAVYGITFDTGSAVIKPESAQAIGEVAKLLQADPGLKIYVVGHTDNVGKPESNLKLSQDRAQAVMQELIKNQGISADRLKSYGCGLYAPVASNDTDEGKAKNRRVELVKQ